MLYWSNRNYPHYSPFVLVKIQLSNSFPCFYIGTIKFLFAQGRPNDRLYQVTSGFRGRCGQRFSGYCLFANKSLNAELGEMVNLVWWFTYQVMLVHDVWSCRLIKQHLSPLLVDSDSLQELLVLLAIQNHHIFCWNQRLDGLLFTKWVWVKIGHPNT